MLSFSVELNPKRPCRYVFKAYLWDKYKERFGDKFNVLIDTGAFNTIVHKALVHRHGTMLKQTMITSVGGYTGESNLCILDKINIGGCVFEKVAALAVSFEGELKDHILLGANVMNNWDFTLSRSKNSLTVSEQFPETTSKREYPYRYCFDNKGRIMALQEMS